jgi:predicted RNA-binding protein associated with RNAse of E/G family
LKTIQICRYRPGKPNQITFENLVSEDRQRLRTFCWLDTAVLPRFQEIWVQAGLLLPDSRISAVRKTLFFQERFQIMELLDSNRAVLGTYCDISSPLSKQNDQYCYLDWFLDVWLSADGLPQVLDADGFEQGEQAGLLKHAEIEAARASLAFIMDEIETGRFPELWLAE